MDYKVEELGPLKKKVNVTVSVEDVDTILDRVVAKYRTTVSVPGFRKGKAPLSMIEKQYAGNIIPEATNLLVDNQVRNIIEELKLEPAAGIDYDAGELKRGEAYVYSFTFDAMPEFDLPDYQDFPLEQDEVDVEASEIDEVLEKVRKDMAEPVLTEEKRKPKDGDIVSLDFNCFDEEGKEIPGIKADNIQMPIGDGQALEGFEEVIKGVKAGEEGEGKVTFPDDFPNPEFAGKTMLVKVKVHAIYERKYPELDDDFARRMGNFESFEALKSAVTSNFMQTRLNGAKSIAQQKLLDSLLKLVEYPLPESMVERYMTIAASNAMQQMQQRGVDPGSPEFNVEKLKEDAREEAEKYVRTYIFLNRAAGAENVTVEEQDIIQQLQRIAASSQRPFEEVRDEYVQNNMISALYERVMADKAMQAIYTKAKITYVKPKPADKAEKGEEKDEGKKPVKKAAAKTAKKPAAKKEDKPGDEPADTGKSGAKPKTSAKKAEK